MSKTPRAMEIAQQVAQSFATGTTVDESLYAPEATTWHNTDEIDISHATSRERLALVRKAVPDFHAEDIHVHAWDGGFSFQYVFVGTLGDGTAIRIPGCIIGTLKDDRIVRIQEYVDSAHAAPLVTALQAHGF